MWLLPDGEVLVSHPTSLSTIGAHLLRAGDLGLSWGKVCLPYPGPMGGGPSGAGRLDSHDLRTRQLRR